MKVTKKTISKETGLTPTQEKACILLASGTPFASVAEAVGITRQTLWVWQKQTTFECYLNRQRKETQNLLTQNLFSLAMDAVEAIRDSLHSENEGVRLRAAQWVADRLQGVEITRTDAIEVAKQEATFADGNLLDWGDSTPYLHDEQYKKALSQMGIEETDYQSTII